MQVARLAEPRVGGHARPAVRAAALEREHELGRGHGLALALVRQREEPQDRLDSLLDGLREAAVLLDRDHERRVLAQRRSRRSCRPAG